MTQNLNLTKDAPLGSSNGRNNFNGKKKSSSTKIIIGIIVAILIIIAIAVAFCFYKNYSEVNAFNKVISNYNSLATKIKNSSDNPTPEECSSYATSLNNMSGEFNLFSNEVFLGKENRLMAKNYSVMAKYKSYFLNFLGPLFKVTTEVTNSIGTPGPDQVQEIINKLQNLITSNDFIQMTNLYNENGYIQKNVPSDSSPNSFKNHVTSFISKLSDFKNSQEFVNDLSNAFGEDAPFNDNPFFGASVNNNNNKVNSNTDSDDTSVPKAYPTTPEEAGNSSSSNTGYMQNLHSLSGKYQDLISNAINQFGHGNGGNLILSGDSSEDSPVIKSYYNTWNNILNDVWGDLRANLPADQMATLTTEENNWINSKKGKNSAEVAQMTKDRAMFLINKYINQSN